MYLSQLPDDQIKAFFREAHRRAQVNGSTPQQEIEKWAAVEKYSGQDLMVLLGTYPRPYMSADTEPPPAISQASLTLTKATTAPTSPKEGDVVFVDGESWHPSGYSFPGVYCFYSNAWHRLG